MNLCFKLLLTAARRRARKDVPGPVRRVQGPSLSGRVLLLTGPRARGAWPVWCRDTRTGWYCWRGSVGEASCTWICVAMITEPLKRALGELGMIDSG